MSFYWILGASLVHAAHDHVVDRVGIYSRTRESLDQDVRGEVRRMGGGQPAVPAPAEQIYANYNY